MGLAERLVDYVTGYVVFHAWGGDLARFLNETARSGVVLKRVRRPGPASLVACVAASRFAALRHPARAARARLRVVRRRGLPFWARRLARRPGLAAGFALAVALVAALGSRIWAVEVAGVPGPQAEQVRQALARLGVRPGTARGAVDPTRVEQELVEALPELAWVDVRVTGSLARVEVRPRRDEQRRELVPGDVVASEDGLVVQIVPAAGWPVVRAGDVVRRGQVLISGRPPLGAPADARPVRAAGVVYARVWAEGFAEVGPELQLFRPSGRRAGGMLVTAGPWQWRFGAVEPPFLRFVTAVHSRRLPGPLAVLPVRWDRVTHEEVELQRFPVEPEQARRMAEEMALEKAATRLGPAPEVLERRISTWEEPTGSGQRLVRSRAVIEAVQNIAAFLPHEGAAGESRGR